MDRCGREQDHPATVVQGWGIGLHNGARAMAGCWPVFLHHLFFSHGDLQGARGPGPRLSNQTPPLLMMKQARPRNPDHRVTLNPSRCTKSIVIHSSRLGFLAGQDLRKPSATFFYFFSAPGRRRGGPNEGTNQNGAGGGAGRGLAHVRCFHGRARPGRHPPGGGMMDQARWCMGWGIGIDSGCEDP